MGYRQMREKNTSNPLLNAISRRRWSSLPNIIDPRTTLPLPSAPSSLQQLRAGLFSAVFIPFDTPARGAALQVNPGMLLVGDHGTVGIVP